MKRRQGFVSNSSTTSFLIAFQVPEDEKDKDAYMLELFCRVFPAKGKLPHDEFRWLARSSISLPADVDDILEILTDIVATRESQVDKLATRIAEETDYLKDPKRMEGAAFMFKIYRDRQRHVASLKHRDGDEEEAISQEIQIQMYSDEENVVGELEWELDHQRSVFKQAKAELESLKKTLDVIRPMQGRGYRIYGITIDQQDYRAKELIEVFLKSDQATLLAKHST